MKKNILLLALIYALSCLIPAVIAEDIDYAEYYGEYYIEGDWIYSSETNKIIGYNGDGGEVVVPPNTTVELIGGSLVKGLPHPQGLYVKEIYPETFIMSENSAIEGYFSSNNLSNTKNIIFNNSAEQMKNVSVAWRHNLEYLKLPDDMTELTLPLNDSPKLKEVILPDTLKKLPDYAFTDCPKLEYITLPKGLEEIGNSAFENSGLKEIIIPNSVTTIGKDTFKDCDNLESITAPSSVDFTIFPANEGLKKINFNCEPTWEMYDYFKYTKWIEDALYSKSGDFAIVDDHLVKYLGNDTDPVIPEGIKHIDRSAFYNKSINSVTFPSTLETIGNSAFASTPLYSVDFPKGLKEIGDSAFGKCYNLTELVLPKSVEKIGYSSFSHCTSLKKLTTEGPTFICGGAFIRTALDKENIHFCEGTVYESEITGVEYVEGDALYYLVDGMPEDVIDTIPNWGTWYTTPMPTGAAPTAIPKSNTTPQPTSAPTPTTTPVPSANPTQSAEPTATASTSPTAVPSDKISVSTDDGVIVKVNDNSVVFPDAKPFIDENNRTQIPIRALAEILDFYVKWDGESMTAELIKENTIITIKIGENTISKNDSTITMDTAAKVVSDRTYIPVRFVGEALGYTVEYK